MIPQKQALSDFYGKGLGVVKTSYLSLRRYSLQLKEVIGALVNAGSESSYDRGVRSAQDFGSDLDLVVNDQQKPMTFETEKTVLVSVPVNPLSQNRDGSKRK